MQRPWDGWSMVGEEVSKDMQRLDNLGGVGGHSKDRQEVGAYSKCNEKSPEGCNKEEASWYLYF